MTGPGKGPRCPRARGIGKVTYLDPGTAYAAALRVSRHLGPVRAYPCDRCSGWHLTTWRTKVGTP